MELDALAPAPSCSAHRTGTSRCMPPAIAEVHEVIGLSRRGPGPGTVNSAELWGAPVEADWRRLLELPDVELAYVFGPHDRMAETCLALIERRIPFVVEKPLGTSLEQLQQVRHAAEDAQVSRRRCR